MVFAPEAREEALQVLRSLVGPVRSHPGCLATRLMRDIGDERILTWVEEWREPRDLERHLRSEAFRRLLAVMELASEPPTFEVDELHRRRGFELVEELLGATAFDPGDTTSSDGGSRSAGVDSNREEPC